MANYVNVYSNYETGQSLAVNLAQSGLTRGGLQSSTGMSESPSVSPGDYVVMPWKLYLLSRPTFNF